MTSFNFRNFTATVERSVGFERETAVGVQTSIEVGWCLMLVVALAGVTSSSKCGCPSACFRAAAVAPFEGFVSSNRGYSTTDAMQLLVDATENAIAGLRANQTVAITVATNSGDGYS